MRIHCCKIFLSSRLHKLLYCFAALFFPFLLNSITVDLREPCYSEGILRTEKGGVISAPNIRIQAQKIEYTRREKDGVWEIYVEAEGDLIVEFGEYIFVGKRLEYDFEAQKGILYDARTSVEPWFFGGREIRLCPDGSYLIYHGFATTSEGIQPDWSIATELACLAKHRILTAKNVNLKCFNIPILWIPRFKINLDTIFNSPFRYTVRFGGTQGARIGVSYDAFTWGGLNTRVILDYRFKRGMGGGLEFDYKSPSYWGRFHSINYIAKDTTIYNDKARTRYRYQGLYGNSLDCGKTTIFGSYDVLSDKEMATDYDDKGLTLETAKRTQLEIHRQETNWIVDLLARFRVNNFQTVKQELPTLSGSLRPIVLGNTGVISDNRFKFSYLELEFSDDSEPEGRDFNSPRYELYHNFYRPFTFNSFNLTPQAGVLAIYYGNNPDRFDRWMTIGLFECDLNTNLYRIYGNCKHVISPYASYFYYTYPTTSPNDHYIFDIDDGWYRLNMLRIGVNNNFYVKLSGQTIYRTLFTDFWVNCFFDTESIPFDVPKAYAKIVYNATPYLRNTIITAWDIERNILDHLNNRLEWTVNTNTAFAIEYRHRSAYDWRKADHTNFILDSFEDAEELRRTDISDRRDTLLLNFFHRFRQNWALAFQARRGWNRDDEPPYLEYEADLLGTFRSAWHLRISYRHRTDDDRISFNFSIGLRKPDPCVYSECPIPCLEF